MLHALRRAPAIVGIGHGVVPAEVDVAVVAIVGLTVPVPRQPGGVHRLLEAAVAQELGMEPELDPLEHELDEVAVKRGADAVLHAARVHAHGGGAGLRVRRRGGEQPGHRSAARSQAGSRTDSCFHGPNLAPDPASGGGAN